jgi:hypothetical protein
MAPSSRPSAATAARKSTPPSAITTLSGLLHVTTAGTTCPPPTTNIGTCTGVPPTARARLTSCSATAIDRFTNGSAPVPEAKRRVERVGAVISAMTLSPRNKSVPACAGGTSGLAPARRTTSSIEETSASGASASENRSCAPCPRTASSDSTRPLVRVTRSTASVSPDCVTTKLARSGAFAFCAAAGAVATATATIATTSRFITGGSPLARRCRSRRSGRLQRRRRQR